MKYFQGPFILHAQLQDYQWHQQIVQPSPGIIPQHVLATFNIPLLHETKQSTSESSSINSDLSTNNKSLNNNLDSKEDEEGTNNINLLSMDDCEESTLLTTTRHQKILEIDRKLITKFKQRNQFPNKNSNKKVVYTRERLTRVKRAVLTE